MPAHASSPSSAFTVFLGSNYAAGLSKAWAFRFDDVYVDVSP